MNSHVWYRFGKFGSSSAQTQKSLSKASFTGTGITVYDLKKEIIAKEHMTKNAADFDFALYNAESGEEFYNDSAVIPRASSVLARRLPPSKPGNGNAQNYVPELLSVSHSKNYTSFSSGQSRHTPTHSKRSDFKSDSHHEQKPASQPEAPVSAIQDSDEAAQIAAMFEAEAEHWQQAKDKMANAEVVPRHFTGRPGFSRGGGHHNPRAFEHSKKVVPPGYICFRCGQKGHWIQECPTNENKEFDNKPRLKRTTGIPRSFLTTVEGPRDGSVMITPEGGYVVAKPDSATWSQHKKLARRNLTEEDVQNLQPSDPDLTCPICSKLLRNAVKTPCCQTAYCENCISDHINDNDNICPECESVIKNESLLKPDTDRRTRVKEYIDEMIKVTKDDSQNKDEEDGRDQTSEYEEDLIKEDVKNEEQSTPVDKPSNEQHFVEKVTSENGTPLHTSASTTTSEGVPLSPPRSPEHSDFPSTSNEKSDLKSNANGRQGSRMQMMGNNQMNAGGMPGNMMMPGGMNGNMPMNGMNNNNMMAVMMMLNNGNNNLGMMMQNDGPGPRGARMNQMMAPGMMGGNGGSGGPMGNRPNPMMIQQMLQQTVQQFQSNPNLPPPMRMQLQMQIQQLQGMLMQVQMSAAQENGSAPNMPNGGGMPSVMMNNPNMPSGMMNNPNIPPVMMNNGFNPNMNMPQNGQMGMFNRMEPQMMGMPNGMAGPQMGFVNNNFNNMQQQQQQQQQGLNAFGMKPLGKPFRNQNQQQPVHNRGNIGGGGTGQKRMRTLDPTEGQERPKMQRQS